MSSSPRQSLRLATAPVLGYDRGVFKVTLEKDHVRAAVVSSVTAATGAKRRGLTRRQWLAYQSNESGPDGDSVGGSSDVNAWKGPVSTMVGLNRHGREMAVSSSTSRRWKFNERSGAARPDLGTWSAGEGD